MNEGYIKFYRKFIKWEWYQDSNTKSLFIHLLLLANFEKKKWKGIIIEKGQVVVGRKKLAEELNLTEQQIRTALNKLKSTNNISIKSTNKFSVVTIINWEKYQFFLEKQPTKQPTNEQTNNQQITTTKKEKNNKEIKNIYSRVELDDTPSDFKEIIACFNKVGIKEESFTKNKIEFHYKNTKTNQELIQAVLDKGYTKDDIMDVIYLKYDQWIENNDENKKDMSTYYRPSTILGEKFEEYLQEAKMKGIS